MADELESYVEKRPIDPCIYLIIFVWWCDALLADSDDMVEVRDLTTSWSSAEAPSLEELNFAAPSGKLVAVIGKVGSGKSSLISALLGEMDKLKGRVAITGSVAFVPQVLFIHHTTPTINVWGFSYRGCKIRQSATT